MEGRHGLFAHVRRLLRTKGYCIILIAEGTPIKGTQEDKAEEAPKAANVDVGMAGTKSVEQDVGKWLRDELKAKLKVAPAEGTCDPEDVGKALSVSLKYIDPSYMVRGVPPNVSDQIYCSLLASQAVHGAFAGFTSFTVGLVNSRTCYIPMTLITAGTRHVNPKGRTWQRVRASTRQPQFTSHPERMDQDTD